MRITGAYPPPLTPAVPADDVTALLARPPRVTRYGRHRRPPRPPAARAWAAASVLLAATGIAAIVVLPGRSPDPARLDVPGAVAEQPARTPPTQSPTAAPVVPVAAARQLPASEPVTVRIPALGVRSAVMRLGLERDGSMQVPPGAHPVGWYVGSPTPGQLGPAVLAGHVDWDGERGAFYGLRELRPGDAVAVDRADGTTATFRVDRVEEHTKDDFPSDEVYGDLDHAGLRLITCGGAFDEDTGDYLDNVIVFASLSA
ncbi:class F sortase [Geodermatophilus sp. TF02-6]|uniref:class F sortase n=1 Tax=Geodermatophilus sp. TF02-6 TaxID=2250575 RepID=UPI000DE8420C|nr:class F sortase [Geodermatophilus sp. TF02-6]RBY80668.1 class F sortase [Geodermatophilus sp. TF02-6]